MVKGWHLSQGRCGERGPLNREWDQKGPIWKEVGYKNGFITLGFLKPLTKKKQGK